MSGDYDFLGFKRPGASYERAVSRGQHELAKKLLENDRWLAEKEQGLAAVALGGCLVACALLLLTSFALVTYAWLFR